MIQVVRARLIASLILCLAPVISWAAEPQVKIAGDTTGQVNARILLDVTGTVSDKPLKVRTAGPDQAARIRIWYDTDRQPGLIEIVVARPGEYLVVVLATGRAEGDTDSTVDFAPWKLVVGGPAPPVPPPTPGPDPPTPPQPPGPGPSPAPIPLPGLRVLIVYESGDLSKLSPGQTAVLYSKPLRDLLNARCAVGPDGKTKEWRIYDADVDTSGDAETWKAAMARPRRSLPWVVISNGTTGYEGPLPATVDEMTRLVEKYAGSN